MVRGLHRIGQKQRKDKRIVREQVFALCAFVCSVLCAGSGSGCSPNCCLLLHSFMPHRRPQNTYKSRDPRHPLATLAPLCGGATERVRVGCRLPVSQLERQSDKHGHKYKICTCVCCGALNKIKV